MEIVIRSNVATVFKDLDKVTRSSIAKIKSLVRKATYETARQIRIQHMSGRGPESVKSLTGRLRRSVVPLPVIESGNIIEGRVAMGQGLSPPYHKLHIKEYPWQVSSVIFPKNARALTIPTDFAKTAGGKPRGTPRDPVWGVTFISQGMIWGFQRGTKREYATPKPLFTLKRSVRIPKRIDPEKILRTTSKPILEVGLMKILDNPNV